MLASILGTTPVQAAQTSPEAIFDGRNTVAVERAGPHTLRWAGHEVGVDEHALLWFDVRPTTEELRQLDIAGFEWVSEPLRIARVRGREGEDGLDVARRLKPGRTSPLRAALPDIQIPRRTQSISLPPDDPSYPAQWYFDRIDIEPAWSLETGSESVTIVVIDNGCDAEHPDLADKLDPGRDVVDGDDDPSFEADVRGNEHGTACAGLAAAATDNGEGIAGSCPGCRVRCVRMLTSEPGGTPLSRDIAAFEFALSVDADVVSNSWGFTQPIPVPGPLRAILERLLQEGRDGAGTVIVFAAGNDNRAIGPDELQAVPGVIGVGATNNFDEATPFSNRGRAVDVVAPTGTLAPDISGSDGQSDGDYTNFFGGTSSACPIVAGIAGLLLSADPNLKALEVEELLRRTAKPSFFATPAPDGHDALYGFGLVQPEAALREVLDPAGSKMDLGPFDAEPPDVGAAGDAGASSTDASQDPAPEITGAESCRSGGRAGGHAPWLLFTLALASTFRRRSRLG